MCTESLLKRLCAVSAAGAENENMRRLLCSLLADFGKVKTDSLGNVLCTFGNGRHFLLGAHYDEVGFVVTAVTQGGFLKIAPLGALDPKILQGREVTVHGRADINGVISMCPVHLKDSKENKIPEISELCVDIAMPEAQAKLAVSPGDAVTFRRSFTKLCGTQIAANCLDNRAGVAAVINSLEKLAKLNVKITVMLSNQEELGTRGAKSAQNGVLSDESIVIDTSFGYNPYCDKNDCGTVGGGAMVGISPVLSKEASGALVAAAKKNGIPFQLEVMNGRTGTDADVISVSGTGVKCSLISIPLKYMHTPVEIVDIRDVDSVTALIVAYISERAGA
ncbi:MAG: M42 family peptidase [Clostridiales bacterium]|nr:M42 family peptidase [Clostridiales bacterium]